MSTATATATTAVEYVIHYIGAKWCATCKTIGPEVKQLAKKFQVPCEEFDYDTMEYNDDITKVPTIRMYAQETKVAEWNVNQVKSLQDWLMTHVNVKCTENDF